MNDASGLLPGTLDLLILKAISLGKLHGYGVLLRIRAALGAAPNRLLLSIFGRVTRQLALGIVVGSLLSGAALSSAGFGVGRATPLLVVVAALMIVVGLVAALGPARRSLRIQAVDALRADG